MYWKKLQLTLFDGCMKCAWKLMQEVDFFNNKFSWLSVKITWYNLYKTSDFWTIFFGIKIIKSIDHFEHG